MNGGPISATRMASPRIDPREVILSAICAAQDPFGAGSKPETLTRIGWSCHRRRERRDYRQLDAIVLIDFNPRYGSSVVSPFFSIFDSAVSPLVPSTLRSILT